ncbi:MAG: secondary thiamine-phosphate synthase enzyme YjbQ [bacterium]|nr:secondary thiamine-phosphate synthase enzyme YjbQ [bacterium]
MPGFSVKTTRRSELIDITAQVASVVEASGLAEGVAHVYVPHTTCGITINEAADPSVAADILMYLDELVPRDHPKYRHAEGNTDAHIKASFMGSSVTVFIEGSRLLLGTWQGIFLGEFDGPRTRRVIVRVDGG